MSAEEMCDEEGADENLPQLSKFVGDLGVRKKITFHTKNAKFDDFEFFWSS